MPLELWLIRDEPWDPQALQGFLSTREHWSVESGWATRQNPDTGVYFSLIWASPEPAGAWRSGERVLFRLNTLRPRYFGFEAEPELAAVCQHFGARVEGLEPYCAEEFLDRWEAVERAAFAALEPDPDGLFAYDPSTLVQMWRWNERRRWLQSLVPELFVPRVGFTQVGDAARATVVWTDVVPAVIPAVDRVLVLRAAMDGSGLVELPEAVLERWCGPAAKVPHIALAHRVIGRPRDELRAWVEASDTTTMVGLAADVVVDADLLAGSG